MKRLLFLLMVLCLLMPAAALAAQGDLPDLEAFSDGLVKFDGYAEKPDYITKVYYGTDENVLQVATKYIELLTEKYNLQEICHFPIVDHTGTMWVYYAFGYTANKPQMNSISTWNDRQGWKINGYHVVIEFSQKDDGYNEQLQIDYCPEFNYVDTGDRIKGAGATAEPTAEPAAKATTKPTVKCDVCDGDGKCDKCGGDMWYSGFEWVYVNGSPESRLVNKLCTAQYCFAGKCSECDGKGYR